MSDMKTEMQDAEQRGMYVHPLALMALVALLAVMATMLVMNGPAGSRQATGSADFAAKMTMASSNLQLYYSTMHPWIVQDHPGTCPICGMELVKMQPADQAEYLANHPELT